MAITRSKVVTVGALSEKEREELQPQLTAIFTQSFDFPDLDLVAKRVIFRSPQAQLKLLYNDTDEIVGFMSLSIEKIRASGRSHAVIDAGTYIKPGVRGAGNHMWRWGLSVVLQYKLKHPLTPIVWIGELMSPVPYQRLTRWVEVYPRRGVEAPASVEDIVTEVINQRGYEFLKQDVWRVCSDQPFGFRDPERIQRFVETSKDSDVEFFVERNPGYLRGDWLVAYAPFNLLHLLKTFKSELSARLSVLQRGSGRFFWKEAGRLAER